MSFNSSPMGHHKKSAYDPNPGNDFLMLRVGLTEIPMKLKKQKLLLVEGTLLERFIMRKEEEKPVVIDGEVYLDRDPELFRYVVDYIATGFEWEVIENDKALDYKVRNEIKYWEIPAPPTKYLNELQYMLKEEPELIHDKVLQMWRKF
jgi:hypothetical protein